MSTELAATTPADRDQGQDPVALLNGVPLTDDEAGYVEAARAANTLRGYRSDWREFATWCTQHDAEPMPAAPATVTGYLSDLARAGAKVGTMSRRLSAIKFAHQMQNLPDPTRNARVVAVWEGIRRTPGAPPDQALPLMPPELFDVLDACPTTKTWRTAGRPAEPDLAGARDRALLLVGFVAALRRSELADLTLDQVAEHPNGLVLTLPRSKTNQTGEQVELVVLPRAANPDRCPVTALTGWTRLAEVTEGPVFRPVGKNNQAAARPLHPESVNALVQKALTRAGLDPSPYSAHSLRAGFVTYAHLRGASDRAIAHQTRPRPAGLDRQRRHHARPLREPLTDAQIRAATLGSASGIDPLHVPRAHSEQCVRPGRVLEGVAGDESGGDELTVGHILADRTLHHVLHAVAIDRGRLDCATFPRSQAAISSTAASRPISSVRPSASSAWGCSGVLLLGSKAPIPKELSCGCRPITSAKLNVGPLLVICAPSRGGRRLDRGILGPRASSIVGTESATPEGTGDHRFAVVHLSPGEGRAAPGGRELGPGGAIRLRPFKDRPAEAP
jgi:site-specific recombinase XerD